MSPRTAARLAWSCCALTFALVGAGIALLVLNGVDSDIELALGLTFPVVGALIASRRPENPIGWIFCFIGLVAGIATFAPQYAIYGGLTDPGSLAGVAWAAWIGHFTWFVAGTLVLTLLPLRFPDGRLLSPRWRWVERLVLSLLVLAVVLDAIFPYEDADVPGVGNPIGIKSARAVIDALAGPIIILIIAMCLASIGSLVIRFHRARGIEREQVKWFVSAVCLCAAVLLTGLFGQLSEAMFTLMVSVAVALIPVAVGIAILRYRLYEIDRIINRTLVYGVLTVLLAGLYFGIVLAFQQVFSSFAGGSDLAIAVSTLAVAALFRPVRGRLQAFVDRRFYRRRYDAQRTLQAFSDHLRDEVDLDQLGVDLGAVIHETMQPAHASLWLRGPGTG